MKRPLLKTKQKEKSALPKPLKASKSKPMLLWGTIFQINHQEFRFKKKNKTFKIKKVVNKFKEIKVKFKWLSSNLNTKLSSVKISQKQTFVNTETNVNSHTESKSCDRKWSRIQTIKANIASSSSIKAAVLLVIDAFSCTTPGRNSRLQIYWFILKIVLSCNESVKIIKIK